MAEKICSLYIRAEANPPNSQQLKKQLQAGNLQEKAVCLRQLIKCIINDDTYPRMIMHIITNIIPVVNNSTALRKAMLLYWEVIERTKSPTDDTLKDEMFLANNSLRNDLLSPNEFLRAKTLRLISRIAHRGIVDPLSNAITDNLSHKSSYVRRNAVICLYQIFLNFGQQVIGDIDEEIEKLLLTETDLSTKRNAFLLLYESNVDKAMGYIQTQMVNQNLDEMGDILQLAVLGTFRRKCREDPSQKPRLLKIIMDFSKKASESVILQCAIALTSITTSSSTLKHSFNAYVSILSSTSELNVKKVILDKLIAVSGSAKYLEDFIPDLLKALSTPSSEIKQKVLQLIRSSLTLPAAVKVLQQIELEFESPKEDLDFERQLVGTLDYIAFSFPETHDRIVDIITHKIFKLKSLHAVSCKLVKDILVYVIQESGAKGDAIISKVIQSFGSINTPELYKGILYLFGSYIHKEELIIKALDTIKLSIGSLPLTRSLLGDINKTSTAADEAPKKIIRTVILPDGTYGTKVVEVQDLQKEIVHLEQQSAFRDAILQDSIIGGIMVRNVSKLFFRIRKSPNAFNKYGCSILMIFCSLLRFYQQNIFEVDQASIDNIAFMIRATTNPALLEKSSALVSDMTAADKRTTPYSTPGLHSQSQDGDAVEKNPEDTIVFRQLKPKNNVFQIDVEDEEINQIINDGRNESTELIARLKTLIQLTGYFDPIYAQTFVTVKNYDVFFDILLINTSNSVLQNVQIQFSSTSDITILEKATTMNLKPGQTAEVRSHIKFSNSEFGSVFGNINYDNQAGIEQAYLVTEEIRIDFLQFIEPAYIPMAQFRQLWKKAQFEGIISKTTPNTNVTDVLRQHQKYLNSRIIDYSPELARENFVNLHLYGRSKLGQDFLITLVLIKSEDKIQLSYTTKAKEKGMLQMVEKKLKDFKIAQEEVEEQQAEAEEK